MKTLCQVLVLLAASVALAGAALPEDKSASHQGGLTNALNTPFSLELKNEPKINWGSKCQFAGLVVDLMQPQETADLFNPYVPAPYWVAPASILPPPVTPARRLSDDMALHDYHFVLLKLSFP